MDKKSLLKLQCVTALALTTFSPLLSTVHTVYAAETSSSTATSNQTLNANFRSKSDQTVLIRITKTGDAALKIKKLTFFKTEVDKDGKTVESSSGFGTTALDDGSEVASMNVKKDSSYRVEIEYDKSGLGSKEATLTTAILLKDGSSSSSSKRFNSEADLDNLQNVALESLKAKSSEIETKLELEKIKNTALVGISVYDVTKDLSTGKLKIEELNDHNEQRKKAILEHVKKFSNFDQSTKNRLQSLRDDVSDEVLKNQNATASSINSKLALFNSEYEKAFSGIAIVDKTTDPKSKEASPKSDNKSDSSANQKSANDHAKTKESVSNKSDANTDSSDKKAQSSDIKNEPAKVAKSVDSKSSNQSNSSSKVDTSKLEEGLKIAEQLLSRQVDTSKVSEEGKKDLEQSKKNLAERVERYKSLVKSEKTDEKSINVAIEDLRAAVGHYSLLLDLKSAVDSKNSSSDSSGQSAKDSKSNKDTDSQKSSASDQSKDQNNSSDLNKADQSKSASDAKSQEIRSKDGQAQGKTPRKFADTGEKDNTNLTVLGFLGLTSMIGFIYKFFKRF